jgi:hypothetical protein
MHWHLAIGLLPLVGGLGVAGAVRLACDIADAPPNLTTDRMMLISAGSAVIGFVLLAVPG